MKAWAVGALGGIIVFAYAFFYILGNSGGGDENPLGLVNSVGLAAVVVGVIAAGVILRRTTPPS